MNTNRSITIPLIRVVIIIMAAAMMASAAAASTITALRPGDEGTAVEVLQAELIRRGFYTYPQITGYYGAETEMAVRAYQATVKLSRDGVAGKTTLRTLFGTKQTGAFSGSTLLSSSPSLASSAKKEEEQPNTVTPKARTTASQTGDDGSGILKKGQTGEDVMAVQRMLTSLGYLSSADGEFGEQTERAVMSFQIASGLLADGQVGPRTIAALGAGDAISADRIAAIGTPNQSKAEKAIAIAKSFLGVKYVYATAGPNSFDCSGLTLYVYKQLGIDLPHTTRLQNAIGAYVPFDQLRMGDLVFFDTIPGNGLAYDHVGIYISNGQFIHAASGSTGRVTISSISSGYYRNAFTIARRLL